MTMLSPVQTGTPKVAVLLYGMLRTFRQTAASFHRHVVEPNNADVFYFGPADSDVAPVSLSGRLDVFGNLKDNPKGRVDPLGGIDQEAFGAAYGPALRWHRFHHVEQEEFARQASVVDRRDWIFGLNPARLFSMVFNMEGVVHLMEEYERDHHVSYDTVIVTRPDIAFFSPVRPRVRPGTLHLPSGEGFDEWGRKHLGNARLLYYKNVETGDYIEGGDKLSFNDQILAFARPDLEAFSGLAKAFSEYLSRHVPASPETVFYLHFCLRRGLQPVLHPEWCYQIHRAGMPLVENVADTSMIRVVDRYHAKAKERFKQDPLGCLLRDAKVLIKRIAHRITR
ncbi:MAG TPA: hypothetical protein VFS39_18960 [Nitrospira sp.]|nr:hypothetical protein [Nitrospira sp.]